MAAISVVGLVVNGDRSASFICDDAADTDSASFTDLAAALLDPAKGGSLENADTAIYAFFADNASADLAGTVAALSENGVMATLLQNSAGLNAASLGFGAASLSFFGAVKGPSILRVSLSSTISA